MRKFSIASAWYHGLEKHNAVDTYHFRQTSRLQLLQWNILGFGYCQLLLISGILLLDSGKLLLISGKLLLNCGKLLLNCGKFWPGQKTNNFVCVFHSFSPVLCIITQFTHIKNIFWKKICPGLLFLAAVEAQTFYSRPGRVATAYSTDKYKYKSSWVGQSTKAHPSLVDYWTRLLKFPT